MNYVIWVKGHFVELFLAMHGLSAECEEEAESSISD